MRYALADIDLAEHVPGTPYRFRHGWVPTAEDIASDVKPASAAVKYGSGMTTLSAAQRKATLSYHEATGFDLYDNPDALFDMDPDKPGYGWGMYQMDGPYQQINKYLRTGKATVTSFGRATEMTNSLMKAFDQWGMDTKTPIKTYRGLVASPEHPDWADELKVGSEYTDKGVISTAPDKDEVGAFLHGISESTNKNSVILEIHVPPGERVLGANRGSIELMLKPGTKFRVKSRSTIAVKSAMDSPRSKYTKLVVEVVK